MITPDPSRATRMLSVSIWLAWLKHSLALPGPRAYPNRPCYSCWLTYLTLPLHLLTSPVCILWCLAWNLLPPCVRPSLFVRPTQVIPLLKPTLPYSDDSHLVAQTPTVAPTIGSRVCRLSSEANWAMGRLA